MKRFIGLMLALTGGAVTIWGAVNVLTGSASARVEITDGVSVTALMGSLVGVTAFTVGLMWARD